MPLSGAAGMALHEAVRLGAQSRHLRTDGIAVRPDTDRRPDRSPKPRERVLGLRRVARDLAGYRGRRISVRLVCAAAALAGLPSRRTGRHAARRTRPCRWPLAAIRPRTKNEQPRTIPLSRQAVAILASLPAFTGPFVFSTDSGTQPIVGFSKWKRGWRPPAWIAGSCVAARSWFATPVAARGQQARSSSSRRMPASSPRRQPSKSSSRTNKSNGNSPAPGSLPDRSQLAGVKNPFAGLRRGD